MLTSGSRGIYKPIKAVFNTPIYERALQLCWFLRSYKSQIAVMTEILRLQQENQLPCAVTAEDISDLLVRESRRSLREQLWEVELQKLNEDDIRPLLQLGWRVNVSLKMRDTEFEARRLLRSPETIPPQFQNPRIISQAHEYARMLTERQQQASSSKLLRPRDVVIEVVPKVVQMFWLPPPSTSFNMPSKELSTLAVGLTKAVEDRVSKVLSSLLCEVAFSRSVRDDVVLTIQEKVKQGYAEDILMEKLKCFATDVLKTISEVAAGEICELFQPRIYTEMSADTKTCIQPADGSEVKASTDEDQEPGVKEKTCSDVTPPPSPLALAAEPPVIVSFNQIAPSPDLDSPVVTTPPPPVTPAKEAESMEAVQDEPIIAGQSVSVDESSSNTTEAKRRKRRGLRKFFSSLRRFFFCRLRTEDGMT